MFGTVFALLYVAHMIADYPLQTDHQAGHKADAGAVGWRANAAHAATHMLTAATALAAGWGILDLSIRLPALATAAIWIGATHSVIDRRWPIQWWMRNTRQKDFAQHGGAAHVDQTAHLAAIALAALALAA